MDVLSFLAGFFVAYILLGIFIVVWSRREGFKQYRKEKVNK